MKPRGLFILDPDALPMVYGPGEQRAIAKLVDLAGPPQTRHSIADCKELLQDVDVLFSGWGAPLIDHVFLDSAPNLKAIFYGAGSIAAVMTPDVWERGIVVSSAYAANAVPVAEYALGAILFSLKHGWALARQTREVRRFPSRDHAPGCYGSTVGLVSLGATGRALLKLLEPFELRVLAYDPYVRQDEAATLGVEMVTLETLFRQSDVVSLHAPLLEETEGMIGGECLASMKRGATFINTARGELVCEREMIEVLRQRPDLQAVLDVAAEEPPQVDSPLYTLPNVVLTPHIAGSVGNECRRMGRYMVDELIRYIEGKPLQWSITPELAARTSHRLMVQRVRHRRLESSKDHAVVSVT